MPGNVFTAAMLICDYERRRLHGVELQTPIRTERRFLGLACPRGFAALCPSHCSTCVALAVRAMMTYVIPTFLRFVTGGLLRVPTITFWQLRTRVALVAGQSGGAACRERVCQDG